MTDNTVSEVKSRLNVVDFIGEYVRLTKAGSSFKGLCPFHNEKTPSFVVSEDRQSWHCFGCQKGGDIITFLMDIEGLEFREALKMLADRAGIVLPSYNPQIEKKTKSAYDVLESATKQYEMWLHGREGAAAKKYLLDRGISEEGMRAFRLGYVPEGWNHIERHLESIGYSGEEINQTGLLVHLQPTTHNIQQENSQRNSSLNVVGRRSSVEGRFYDRFRNRILFPIGDILGRVIGYSARVMPGADEKQGKYINTPETTLYHKSRVLYGIAQAKQAIKRENRVIVVEGNMDVIAMHQAGFDNTVAVSGTAMTEEHIAVLGRYTKNVVLFFDMDGAGRTAAYKSAIACLHGDLRVSVVSLSAGKDAAELAQTDPELLRTSVRDAKSAMEYYVGEAMGKHDVTKPEEKRLAIEELLPLLANMGSEVERFDWARKVADRFDTDTQAVLAALARYMEKESGVVRRADRSGESSAIGEKKREEIVRRTILSRLFHSRGVWKRAVSHVQSEMDADAANAFCEEGLARLAVQQGAQVDYDFDRFRAVLTRDEEVREAQNLYSLAEHGEESENEKEQWAEVAELFHAFEKEMYKGLLDDLVRKMRKADAEGDGAGRDALAQQFGEVSRKMQAI